MLVTVIFVIMHVLSQSPVDRSNIEMCSVKTGRALLRVERKKDSPFLSFPPLSFPSLPFSFLSSPSLPCSLPSPAPPIPSPPPRLIVFVKLCPSLLAPVLSLSLR